MSILEDLVRGDTRTITVDGLVDEDGIPTVFGVTDVVTFTMKRHHNQTDADALIQKISPDGIEIFVGTDVAIITLIPADFVDFPHRDVPYVWDVQVVLATDPPTVCTVASGEGVVVADSTITVS